MVNEYETLSSEYIAHLVNEAESLIVSASLLPVNTLFPAKPTPAPAKKRVRKTHAKKPTPTPQSPVDSTT